MTLVVQMAAFVTKASYEDLSEAARTQLKVRVLDSLGCALGALEAEPMKLIGSQVEDFGVPRVARRSPAAAQPRTAPHFLAELHQW